MNTSLFLCISLDGLIATSNQVSNEISEWSESTWAGWCGHFLWIKNMAPADGHLFKHEVEKLGIECNIMQYGDEIEV